MRPSMHQKFVDKSIAAITAAVEIYNKPNFAYREETFCILALNAWELLLKAKVLKDSNNSISSLRVYEQRINKEGKKTRRKYLKLNRAGNPQSINLATCIRKLDQSSDSQLPKEVKTNLQALAEIRDNSVHFITASATLARQAQELSAASVSNFIALAKTWFNRDFPSILNLILPLSFVAPPQDNEALVVSKDEARLIEHLRLIAEETGIDQGDYSVAVRVQVKLEKSSLAAASKIQISKEDGALKIELTEADIRDRYPWDYEELNSRLKKRYINFKINQRYHDLRKSLQSDEKHSKERLLDPAYPKGTSKRFFNSNILKAFDEHYIKQ